MASDNTITAPVYRYFTVDLMTNKVLMEIPFQGVTYERALKNAGGFEGEIPAIENTRQLGLYENTMPGQTGLYVVRDDICVWGGIIWSRDYNVVQKVLKVSASEFTSYFHHRLIWKTLNYEYGCTVNVTDPSSAQITTLRNLDVNPTLSVAADNWDALNLATAGTGATASRITSNTPSIPGYNPVTSLGSYYQVTFGSGATVASGIRHVIPFPPQAQRGDTVNISVYVKTTGVSKPIQLRAYWADRDYQTTGYPYVPIEGLSPAYSVAVNSSTSWQQYTITGFTLNDAAYSAGIILDIYAPSGTAWSSGQSLHTTASRLSITTDLTDTVFFSGDTPKVTTPSYIDSYGWEGFAGTSASIFTHYVPLTETSLPVTQVTIDNGTARDVTVGAPVRLSFYDPADFRYDGYYRVTSRDSPTSSTFTIDSSIQSKIVSVKRDTLDSVYKVYSFVTYTTEGPHNLSTGDVINLSGFTGDLSLYNGPGTVSSVSTSLDTYSFNVYYSENGTQTALPGGIRNPAPPRTVDAVVSRALPQGAVFENVTLTTQTDTYDYIRGLINSTWEDFVGVGIANDYLEPGVSQEFDVLSTVSEGGYATIVTGQPHGLSVGQSVEIKQTPPMYRGNWVVTDTPSSTSFRFKLDVSQVQVALTVRSGIIATRSLNNGVATITLTSGSNVPSVGDVVEIEPTEDVDGHADLFTGKFTVASKPTSSSFTYNVSSPLTLPAVPLESTSIATRVITGRRQDASSGVYYDTTSNTSSGSIGAMSLVNGILDLTTNNPSTRVSVGDIADVRASITVPIVERAWDAATKKWTVRTAKPHNLMVNDPVQFKGVRESFDITRMAIKNNNITVTTNKPHIYRIGDLVGVQELSDDFSSVQILKVEEGTHPFVPTLKSRYASVVLDNGNHTLARDIRYQEESGVYFSNLYSYFSVKSISIKNNTATVVTHQPHAFVPTDSITLAGITESSRVVSREIQNGIAILTMDSPHNMQVSDEITVLGVGAPYNTVSGVSTIILETTATRIYYQLRDSAGNDDKSSSQNPVKSSGTVQTKNSTLNGTFGISTVPNNTVEGADSFTFAITANDSATRTYSTSSGVSVGGLNFLCKGLRDYAQDSELTYSFTEPAAAPLRVLKFYVGFPRPMGAVPVSRSRDTTVLPPEIRTSHLLNPRSTTFPQATFKVIGSSKYTVTFSLAGDIRFDPDYIPGGGAASPIALRDVPEKAVGSGALFSPSFLNAYGVNQTLAVGEVVDDYTIRGVLSSSGGSTISPSYLNQNISESSAGTGAYLRFRGAIEGTGTVVEVINASRIRIALKNNNRYGSKKNQYHKDIIGLAFSKNIVKVRPIAAVSSYGPFPGNSNLGMTFSTSSYSGVDVKPTAYRGFTLVSVGDALDEYSASTDGFEYRVDCSYDSSTDSFGRTFVLIPRNFPNPPLAGEPSPPSRFGADKLVFEYPGNVSNISLQESAENAATRFFAVGDADLGADTANPYSAATSSELLNATNSRRWPILDAKEDVSGISDKSVLYSYAKQYLGEARPPEADITVSINGSLQPKIDSFLPGDWCSIIVRDDFLQDRLASQLEPRDTVFVRKIDSYKVKVPDGNTFPEVVTLNLIAETDIDRIS